MKKLFIIRHAKAQNEVAGQIDFDRQLTPGGMEEAEKAGEYLLKYLSENPYLMASPAKRTTMTAEIIAQKIGFDPTNIQYERSIYQAYPDTMANLVCELPDTTDCAILVGHNPGVHQLSSAYAAYEIENFPTCSMAGLLFEVDTWSEVEIGKGDLFLLESPQNI